MKRTKKDLVEAFIINDKLKDYYTIYDKFQLNNIIKLSSLLFDKNFNVLILEVDRKNFYNSYNTFNKVGYMPFIKDKRKIHIKNKD